MAIRYYLDHSVYTAPPLVMLYTFRSVPTCAAMLPCAEQFLVRSAPGEPAVISLSVSCDRTAQRAVPAVESVTSLSSVRETHRTARLILTKEMAAYAIMTVTTVSRGHVRRTTHNVITTSVSSCHIILFPVIPEEMFADKTCSLEPSNYVTGLHVTQWSGCLYCTYVLQIPVKVTIAVTLKMLWGKDMVTAATIRLTSFLVPTGEYVIYAT